MTAGAGRGTVRGRLFATGSLGSMLARRRGRLDAGSTMRLQPTSTILAAALIAPVAAFPPCGGPDRAAPPPAAEATTTNAAVPPAATLSPPSLASRPRGVVEAGSPSVISLIND